MAKILQLALDGNIPALLHIWDRIDGKVKEHIIQEHPGVIFVTDATEEVIAAEGAYLDTLRRKSGVMDE